MIDLLDLKKCRLPEGLLLRDVHTRRNPLRYALISYMLFGVDEAESEI